MSLRKSRKRRAAGKAAKLVAMVKLAQPVSGAVKAYTGARAAKGLAKRAPERKPLAIAAGVLGAAGIAAAIGKRRKSDDLGYGPPNESHPSHETLAPAQAAAGHAS